MSGGREGRGRADAPSQYQEPGASHLRLAGSAAQALDFLATLSTWKIRTLLYLVILTSRNSLGLILMPGCWLWYVSVCSSDLEPWKREHVGSPAASSQHQHQD